MFIIISMNKEGKHFRTETIVTYLFIVVLVGSGIVLLKFLGGGFTGLAVYEGPGEDQTTLMLQEAGTENLMDAYVGAAGDANKNFGTSTLLKTGDTARIYMMFNISEIPANQNADNSILCLYVSTKKVQLINVSHVYVHDWNEGSITWNNQPCGTNFDNSSACNLTTESSAQVNSASQYTWLCWNVTNMLGEDYESENKKASMILHTTDADINSFHSKEYSDSSLRPYLNITYSSSNPTVSITSPQEGEGFNYNTSLPLNFTITNATILDTCWYTLNMGVSNTTIINCQNTTFNASDGDYELRLYSNDTSGNIGSDSINFTVSAVGVSLSISEPSGTKPSRTGISITFSVVGNNLTCWYNVKTSIGGDVIGNTTLANCFGSSFVVSNDGDYVFNLFANNSLGASSSTISSFTVSTPSSSPPSSGGGGGSGGGSTTIIQTTNITTELTVNPIFGFIADPGESKKIKWGVKNTGTSFLNDCVFESFGDYLSWISGKETKSLSAGEEYELVFDLNIPEDTESGSYELGVVSNCKETSGSIKFNVEIIEKKLQIDLLEIIREDDKVRISCE